MVGTKPTDSFLRAYWLRRARKSATLVMIGMPAMVIVSSCVLVCYMKCCIGTEKEPRRKSLSPGEGVSLLSGLSNVPG